MQVLVFGKPEPGFTGKCGDDAKGTLHVALLIGLLPIVVHKVT